MLIAPTDLLIIYVFLMFSSGIRFLPDDEVNNLKFLMPDNNWAISLTLLGK